MTTTPSRPYAAGTRRSAEDTHREIEALLTDAGATRFLYGRDDATGRALIGCELGGLQLRFTVRLAGEGDPAVLEEARRLARVAKRRLPTNAREARDLVMRQRWRALALIIKAKLVAIAEDIRTFEQEFGMDVVTPSGATVGELVGAQLRQIAASGQVPPLLPPPQLERP